MTAGTCAPGQRSRTLLLDGGSGRRDRKGDPVVEVRRGPARLLAGTTALALTATLTAAASTPAAGVTLCDIWGTSKADVIRGAPGPDRICGLGGDDVIWGLAGGDIIWGDGGGDVLIGGDGRDFLNGGPGRDTLKGGQGIDRP